MYGKRHKAQSDEPSRALRARVCSDRFAVAGGGQQEARAKFPVRLGV